jgi:hypothetical protein
LDPAFLGPLTGSPANTVHPDLALIIMISICAAAARVQHAPKKLLVGFPAQGSHYFLSLFFGFGFSFWWKLLQGEDDVVLEPPN